MLFAGSRKKTEEAKTLMSFGEVDRGDRVRRRVLDYLATKPRFSRSQPTLHDPMSFRGIVSQSCNGEIFAFDRAVREQLVVVPAGPGFDAEED